jgi:hypothetical protein
VTDTAPTAAAWNHSQTDSTITVDQLIKDAHTALEAAGIAVSHSKVSRRIRAKVDRAGISTATRMIRAYIGQTQDRGSFDAYCLTYADPTGEAAVANLARRSIAGGSSGGK